MFQAAESFSLFASHTNEQDPSALAEKHEAHIHDGLNTAWLQLQARMQPRATVTGSTHSYQHTVPATVV